MRKLEEIIALTIIALAILFGAAYIFVNVMGKSILIKQIEQATHKKTTIGYFNLSPTLKLEIKKLKVEGLAEIDSLFITPDILGFLSGKAIIDNLRLIRPEFTFNKTPPVVVNGGKTGGELILPAPKQTPPEQPKGFKPLPLGFKYIRIENGKINYIDQTISTNGIRIALENINCKISQLYFYLRPVATSFEIKGKIPWREGQVSGQLDIEGWFDYYKKSMQASLKIKDIDAIYLYPYYSMWVDLEKARIEKAKLNFSADVHGLNNNVNVECHLELTDLVRRPLEPGQSEEKASKITNKVIDIFREVDQGKVELNFNIKTRMDSPQFGLDAFRTAFEDKLGRGREKGFRAENTLVLPLKVLEGGVRGFTDLTRAMVDGIFAIGGELNKAAEGNLQR
ncbi:MAG: DUF748 domain-containing protein [Candidatus Omnitrophica bacterium]|nr:DUF748 domain-containing protein [Candidatus Omnitrophota bacterium]